MSGTKEGGNKAKLKNLAKDPDFYKKIGIIGGKNGKTGGFYYSWINGLNWQIEAGRKGGRKSRKGKKEQTNHE